MKQSELAEKTGKSKSTISLMMKKIERDGWGTKAERKLADAMGKRIVVIDK